MRATDGVSAAGPSLLEKLWDELDTIMDCLKSSEFGPPEKWTSDQDPNPRDPDQVGSADDWMKWGELRGQAQGVAFAIATIEDPYNPSVPDVKSRAVERWEERQQENSN